MVRWRLALVLAMLMLTVSRSEDQDDENQDMEDDDNDDKDDDDDEPTEKIKPRSYGSHGSTPFLKVTRTPSKRPLDCYECSYKKDSQNLNCLDPAKTNATSKSCHSGSERCFTAVITRDSEIEMVARGCRSTCVGTPDITCCDTNRCNNQQFVPPNLDLRMMGNYACSKCLQHSILYFVTILLLLQTVVKVNIL